MATILHIHPQNPQQRLIKQAAAEIAAGRVVVAPSDAAYVLVCGIDEKDALERIQRLRELDPHHPMTLLCRDQSQLARYAKVDNAAFRLMKKACPGPFTFILPATNDVPRRLLPKRRTIGVRVCQHPVIDGLLGLQDEPLLVTTLRMPEEELPLSEEDDVVERLATLVDMILVSGACGLETTTVIDLSEGVPKVVREGLGDSSQIGL